MYILPFSDPNKNDFGGFLTGAGGDENLKINLIWPYEKHIAMSE